jgi:hypothetical protein
MTNIVFGGGSAEAYTIDNSLQFNPDDITVLTGPTWGASDSLTTWTVSCWVKRSGFGALQYIWTSAQTASGANSTKQIGVDFTSGDTLNVGHDDGVILTTSQVFRDPAAWYHIVVAFDTTQNTAADRVKLYINGEQVTAFSTANYPAEDSETGWPKSQEHYIGHGRTLNSYKFDGYIAEFYSIDGTALDASSFGETDADTNQWKPIDASGLTFGTNGFYQKYSATELAASFEDSAYHSVHTVTAVGDVHTDTTVKKFGTASAQFDGTGDQLTMPYSTDWAQMAYEKDFTLDFWMYATDRTAGDAIISCQAGGIQTFEINFINSSPPLIRYAAWDGGAWTNVDSAEVGADAWHHYAIVRSSGYFTPYVDGVPGTSVADPGDLISEPGATFNIGASYYGTAYEGYIDEVRLSDTARWTSNFSASLPSSAYTADVNTLLLLHMDGSDSGTTFTDSSWTGVGTPGHTITANGDVANTRAQSKVGDSSIKFDGTGDYLSVAASSDFALETSDFTVEMWVRPGDVPATEAKTIFDLRSPSNTNGPYMYFSDAETLYVNNGAGGEISTDMDVGTWYHVAYVRDGEVIRLYKDGVQAGSATESHFSDTADRSVVIGRSQRYSDYYYSGYVDEVRISNSCRYPDGTTFTAFGQDGGTIASPTPFTADSNTKLLIHSDWTGGLGADSSGNENDFAVTNLVATDQVVDSPTNNFCTLNPLAIKGTGETYSEGNLTVTDSGADWSHAQCTFLIESGKWYWEYLAPESTMVGVHDLITDTSGHLGNTGYAYYSNGNKYDHGSSSSYGATHNIGDILGVAFDMDVGTITFYKNGVSQGLAFSGITGSYVPAVAIVDTRINRLNFGQDSSFAGNKTAQGNQDSNGIGDFYYEPPTDYLALCTSNLPSPEIALPTDHFNSILWTGDGTSPRSFTGVGFTPDLSWTKNRNTGVSHQLYDTIRGAGNDKELASDATNAEGGGNAETYGYLSAFGSDGFTTTDGSGSPNYYFNENTKNFVSWNWKAGTTFDPKDDGTIAVASGSKNVTAGFSIVKYTGESGSNFTVGHGLSVAPEMIIIKNLDQVVYWIVVSPDNISTTKRLVLNTTAAQTTGSGLEPPYIDSTVFTLMDGASATNDGASDYIAYCFHSIEGYSKVGSYTGNGSADGAFVYTGFKPAFLLIKRIAGVQDWMLADNKTSPYNQTEYMLRPAQSAAQQSGNTIDILSNGFKPRLTGSAFNTSGEKYLVLAIAESPFKTSNAR